MGNSPLHSTSQFIQKAIKKHGNKFDYSKVEYTGSHNKVCIICSEHGEFYQTATNHLTGNGCKKCAYLYSHGKYRLTTIETFLSQAKRIHGDKYDYSNVKWKNTSAKIAIICPIHGGFKQNANQHLNGHGCPRCNFDKMAKDRAMGKELFINKAKELFGDKFNYSKVKYINGQTNVCLICTEHGKFEVTPNNHLSKKSGCPSCNESKLERKLASILDEQNIVYVSQQRFKWLGRQSLDFYLQELNMAVECQGVQHFKPVDFGGKGEKSANELFEKNKERDDRKLKKCLSNNIEMIWVVDNEEYLKNKWHFDIVEPFSGNTSYKIIHISNFKNYINHLRATIKYL